MTNQNTTQPPPLSDNLSDKIDANKEALKRYSVEDIIPSQEDLDIGDKILEGYGDKEYTEEELLLSPRIFKSATPKYTLDWYVKWVASVFVLCAMSMRGIEGLQMYDLSLSLVGISLWLWVSILWNDRALIILNGVGLLFLLRSFLSIVFV
jgi:hypothetical protein